MSQIPRWQGRLVLVGFPLAYMANSFTPWSYGLFGEDNRGWYMPFFYSIIFLHWLSVAVVVILLKRARVPLTEMGFRWKSRGVAAFILILAAAGASLIALRTSWGTSDPPTEQWMMLYPYTVAEKWLWILVSISAGFCEEFVYRGFGIRFLESGGWRVWQAVALTTLSFVFIHGIAAFFAFPFYALAGLAFAAIFLWRNSLAPVIYCHSLFDLSAILAL